MHKQRKKCLSIQDVHVKRKNNSHRADQEHRARLAIHTSVCTMAKIPLRWYQRCVSPWFVRRCKYEPTCSEYCQQAIHVHGIFKGTLLSGWRIIRCNPWSSGGVDWVPQRGHWPTHPLDYEELMKYRQQHSDTA